MKKLIALALCLTTAVSAALLCGCGKVRVPVSSADAEAQTAPQQASQGSPAQGTPQGTPQGNTQAVTAAPAQQDGMVEPTWFNDAVFVGDSITTTLDYFCADDPGLLGDAMFVCADSLSFHNAQWDINDPDAVHPTYRGEKVLAETAAEVTGANKLFILLGVNDIDSSYGVEDSVESMKTFIQKVLSRSPNVQIYMQSTTPMIPEKENDHISNALIREFDEKMQAFCSENGYHYLDLYHQMCDDTGALRAEWCDDPNEDGIHFNYQGTLAWVNYLRSAVAGA